MHCKPPFGLVHQKRTLHCIITAIMGITHRQEPPHPSSPYVLQRLQYSTAGNLVPDCSRSSPAM